MKYQEEFEKLDEYAQMKTSEDIRNFEITVWDLAKTQDPDVLYKLMDYFDDDCKHTEAMWSLIHALEQEKPYKTYVRSFLCMMNPEITRRKKWMEIILYRILNDDKCLNFLEDNIHLAHQKILLEIINKIEKESVVHRIIIKKLKSILENGLCKNK